MTLENELSSALTSDTVTAETLNALIERAQVAIAEADAEAKREQERIFDPQICQNPLEARAAMDDALLLVGRLNTLLTRAHRKRSQVMADETRTAWETEFNTLKAERDALAAELVNTYPEAAAKLTDLFTRIAAFDARLSQLHQTRPSSIKSSLADIELEVRGLERFTRDEPSIINQVRLYDLSTGKQLWPPSVSRDMSIFAPPNYLNTGPEWWSEQTRQTRAAKIQAESDRVTEYYSNAAKERAERERQEDIDRWKNLDGGASK